MLPVEELERIHTNCPQDRISQSNHDDPVKFYTTEGFKNVSNSIVFTFTEVDLSTI